MALSLAEPAGNPAAKATIHFPLCPGYSEIISRNHYSAVGAALSLSLDDLS
jgi:hypothetical protein